jgi:taurine dioxygenase
MSTTQHETERVSGALGAEVSGIDFREPLDADGQKALANSLVEHQVLFFRDQDLTPDQHKAIGKYFGDLHVHPVLPSRKEEGHPEIVILESSAKVPFVADRWHSDVTFESKPPLGSVLRGVIVPEHGGDTLWASATAAYEGLSDSMQRLMSNLEAVHDGSLFRAIADESQKGELAKDQTAKHPVIRTHPVSGKKTIYVNSTFTKSIVGMKPKESAAILNFLCEHVNSVEYTCRFHWKKNSLAIWDNRATQHSVVADNLNARRRVERVTICGDEPF